MLRNLQECYIILCGTIMGQLNRFSLLVGTNRFTKELDNMILVGRIQGKNEGCPHSFCTSDVNCLLVRFNNVLYNRKS